MITAKEAWHKTVDADWLLSSIETQIDIAAKHKKFHIDVEVTDISDQEILFLNDTLTELGYQFSYDTTEGYREAWSEDPEEPAFEFYDATYLHISWYAESNKH